MDLPVIYKTLKQLSMIKQIWFDFGNVFIPVFPNLAQESFENRNVQLTQEEIKLLNNSLETGKLEDLEFFENYSLKF